MTTALTVIRQNLGSPLEASDLKLSDSTWYSDFDRHLLIAVYPDKFQLKSSGADAATEARWIGMSGEVARQADLRTCMLLCQRRL
jgi:hypothetical protein